MIGGRARNILVRSKLIEIFCEVVSLNLLVCDYLWHLPEVVGEELVDMGDVKLDMLRNANGPGVSSLFFKEGTIFSSKCSIAIDDISLNSCNISLVRGKVLAPSTVLNT